MVSKYLAERGLLQDLPNVLTYQRAVETEKAGYLIRQWLTNNLYDRIRFVSSYHLHICLELLISYCQSNES